MFQGSVKRFLQRLRISSGYDEISGLFIYTSIAVVLLYISFIHPSIFVFYFSFLFILFKKSRILFIYSLVLSGVFLFIYIHYVFSYTSYTFNTSIEGVVTLKDEKSITLREGLHYIKVYTNEVDKITIGEKIRVYGIVTKIVPRNVKNTFSYERYLMRKRIYKEINMSYFEHIKYTHFITALRGKIIAYIDTKFSKDSSIYLKELILGISSFDDNISEGISKTGIVYLFAISGLHITILSSIIIRIFEKLRVPLEIINIITISFLLFYMVLANNSVSIRRAVLMTSFDLIFKIFNKRVNRLDSLSLSMFICLLINPFEIFGLGFYLSFLSTMAIFLNEEKSTIKTTITILSFGIPFLLYFNHSISLYIILFSLFFNVIFTKLLIPLTYLTFVFRPMDFIYKYIVKALNFLIEVSGGISVSIKYSITSVFMLVLITMIMFFIYSDKTKWKRSLILLGSFIIINYLSGRIALIPTVTFFDVGQGDSCLLRVGFKTALIDTGNKDNYETTINYLKSKNIHKIDYVFISHEDSDHMGEYEDIASHFKIGKFYMYEDGERAKMGPFQIESFSLKNASSPNEKSMTLYIRIYKQSYFFSGDIEKEGEKYILKKGIKNVTYLKVPHHGSITSSSIDFIKHLNPKIAVISVSKYNQYGHPNSEVLKRYEDNNSIIYRTDEYGTVTVKHYLGFSYISTYRHSYIYPFGFLKGSRFVFNN